MKTMHKSSTTVFLRHDQVPALAAMAALLGVSQSSLLREAVDMVLARYAGRTGPMDWREAATVGAGIAAPSHEGA